MISGTVSVNLPNLRRFKGVVDRGGGHIDKAIKQWAARYRAFLQRRFDQFSKGGGDWKALAESTIRGRRGKGKNVAILRDTGTLFAALNPVFKGTPGAYERRTKYGIEVGYGGPSRYPGGAATIADIAAFHQTGGPNLPRRRIVVPPDAATIRGMVSDMERAMKQELGSG